LQGARGPPPEPLSFETDLVRAHSRYCWEKCVSSGFGYGCLSSVGLFDRDDLHDCDVRHIA